MSLYICNHVKTRACKIKKKPPSVASYIVDCAQFYYTANDSRRVPWRMMLVAMHTTAIVDTLRLWKKKQNKKTK